MTQDERDRLMNQAIDRGVEHLDKRDPGWLAVVDPPSLNMASGADCVLGQTMGPTLRTTKLDEEDDRNLGFMLPQKVLDAYLDDPVVPGTIDAPCPSRAGYARLTELWKAKIRALRAARLPAPAPTCPTSRSTP